MESVSWGGGDEKKAFYGTSCILETRKNQETRGREAGFLILIAWLKNKHCVLLQRFGWLNPVNLLKEGLFLPACFMWSSQSLSDLVRNLEEYCMGELICPITLVGTKVCFYRTEATETPLTSPLAKKSWFAAVHGLTSGAENHILSITHWFTLLERLLWPGWVDAEGT